MTLINIGIAGCLGRMGRELIKETVNNHLTNFTGGFENPQHKNINKKISDLLLIETNHVVSDDPKSIFSQSDVLIDFTTPELTLKNISLAVEYGVCLVIGTTGLDKKILNAIKDYSNKIAILQSNNMSLGVNLLFNLVQQAASVLKDIDYDIEISETHHKHKVDAPSGTALSLGQRAAKGRNINFDEVKILDRTSQPISRKTGQIGFAVTRGGEIAGEHIVSFVGKNDRINLAHTANNRSIFVKGAIKAAIFLSCKKNGLYSMNDVIECK